jgi:hypothetical protein
MTANNEPQLPRQLTQPLDLKPSQAAQPLQQQPIQLSQPLLP